jgi:hypothetical protein
VNDVATQRDEKHYKLLYSRTPLLASRLLKSSTEWIWEPMQTWNMRRALIHWSSRRVWVKENRLTNPTPKLPDFKELADTIGQNHPHLIKSAELIRRKYYYDLNRELADLWKKWQPNIEAASLVRDRARWLTAVAPVLRAAEIL